MIGACIKMYVLMNELNALHLPKPISVVETEIVCENVQLQPERPPINWLNARMHVVVKCVLIQFDAIFMEVKFFRSTK